MWEKECGASKDKPSSMIDALKMIPFTEDIVEEIKRNCPSEDTPRRPEATSEPRSPDIRGRKRTRASSASPPFTSKSYNDH